MTSRSALQLCHLTNHLTSYKLQILCVCVSVCVGVCDSDLSVLWWIHPVHVTYRLNHLYKETDYPLPAKMAANSHKHSHMQNTHTHKSTQSTRKHPQTHHLCYQERSGIGHWPLNSTISYTDMVVIYPVCVYVYVCDTMWMCVCWRQVCVRAAPLHSFSHKLPVNCRTDRTREMEGGKDRKKLLCLFINSQKGSTVTAASECGLN